MRRKLLLANAAFLALAAAGLWRLRVEYKRARGRYQILTADAAKKPARPAPAAEPPAPPPVTPAAYLDAAEKFLFSPDRNPNIIVEPVKVKEKPRPTLPQLFGVMNIGDGPVAIMAVDSRSPHKVVRIGDNIGEFKLLGATGDDILLEWDGQKIHARVSDVLVRPSQAESAPATVASAPAPAARGSNIMSANGSDAGRPNEYKIGGPQQTASGVIYTSLPGDTAPNGTIYQGKRKVVRETPFGTQSWWEDVK
jgi:hypothetical protein